MYTLLHSTIHKLCNVYQFYYMYRCNWTAIDRRKGLRIDWAGRPFENHCGLEPQYNTSDTVERDKQWGTQMRNLVKFGSRIMNGTNNRSTGHPECGSLEGST